MRNIDKKRTALLVMDIQRGIVSRYAKGPNDLAPFQKAVQAARENEVSAIFIRVAFREGHPEVSLNNKAFSAISAQGGLNESEVDIDDAVKPRPDEPIVTKRRVSAFTGSDLEVILRAQKIDSLVLFGIATSGVVLSTLREAADKDYQLTVLSDACLDGDEEVNRALLEKVFPRQAEVITVEEWNSLIS